MPVPLSPSWVCVEDVCESLEEPSPILFVPLGFAPYWENLLGWSHSGGEEVAHRHLDLQVRFRLYPHKFALYWTSFRFHGILDGWFVGMAPGKISHPFST